MAVAKDAAAAGKRQAAFPYLAEGGLLQ